jgi:hypothetical protein
LQFRIQDFFQVGIGYKIRRYDFVTGLAKTICYVLDVVGQAPDFVYQDDCRARLFGLASSVSWNAGVFILDANHGMLVFGHRNKISF